MGSIYMTLIGKVKKRERLTQEEGEALYDLDLFTLGELADEIRQEKLARTHTVSVGMHTRVFISCFILISHIHSHAGAMGARK